MRQMAWFWYQLKLARKFRLPLILHVRNAYPQALKLLKLHPARKNGGVLHCFNGTWADAEGYLEMGFFLGIGGSILQKEERAGAVWEVVRNIELALELPGGVYNFGASNDKSTYELVMYICHIMGNDTSFVSKMENATFRNLTMAQEKINRFGIFFSTTEEGVLRCLKEQI